MATKTAKGAARLRIKLVKSPIGYSKRHKDTIKSLGLRKMNQSVEMVDSPSLRGMLLMVNHLVSIEEVEK
jgi:large subunit ribosomal protein L30